MNRRRENNDPQNYMEEVRRIKAFLIAALYQEQESTIKEKLSDIAWLNRTLLKAATPTFMFEEQIYCGRSFTIDFKDKNTNKLLHPSLKDKVFNLVHHEEFSDMTDRFQIENLISNILIESRCSEDIIALLPGILRPSVASAGIYALSQGTPMTAEELALFKHNNKAGYQCFGKFALLQLLTPKN